MPPPGLHRLNRTEYANAIRDLLAVEVDPSKYLPVGRFHARLRQCRRRIDAFAGAARRLHLGRRKDQPHGGRRRVGQGDSAAVQISYRVPEDTSQDYHIEGMPFGTRGGMIVKYEFPADGEYAIKITPISKGNMGNTNPFGEIPGEKLEFLLDGERLKLFDWDTGRQRGRRHVITSSSRPRRVCTPWSSPSWPPTTRPATIWISTSCAAPSRPAAFPDSSSSRTSARSGSTAPTTPRAPAIPTAAARFSFASPAAAAQETACAKQIVSALARRAFRRPVTDAGYRNADGLLSAGPERRRRLRSRHRDGSAPHPDGPRVLFPQGSRAGQR